MKTTKKLLLALVTLLILSSVTMAVVFANEPAKGSLNEAGKLMGNITSAATAADKVAAIEAFDVYMAEHTFDLSKDIDKLNYSIIIESASAAKLEFTEANIETVKASASYRLMLDSTKLNAQVANLFEFEALLESLYFDKETKSYKDFASECATLTAAAYAEYNKRIEENYTAPFGEYELPVVLTNDFEPNASGAITKLSHSNGVANFGSYKADGKGAHGSTGYYYEVIPNRKDLGDPYTYIESLSAGSYAGFVLEFDYYHTAGASLQLSRGTISLNGLENKNTEYGSFSSGKYNLGYSGFQSKANNALMNNGLESVDSYMVDNSWNHIAFAFVKETGTFYVYCNYKYLACFKWTAVGAPVDFVPASMRFKYTGNGMCLDNFVLYYGTTPRIFDRFEKMSTEERFIVSSEVIVDDTQPFEDREDAYEWMQDNIAYFYNGSEYKFGISDEAKAAVDRYLATNYPAMKILDHMKTIQTSTDHQFRLERYDDLALYFDEMNYIINKKTDDGIVKAANEEAIGKDNTALIDAVNAYITIKRSDIELEFLTENLAGLQTLYAAFEAIDAKTITTITQRETKLVEIDGYLKSVGEANILPGEAFDKIKLGIEQAYAKVAFDNAVKSLQDALVSFANAPTYESQLKWVGRIEGFIILEDGSSIFADLTLLAELPEIKEEYESISSMMEVTIRENNAKKIILCTDYYKEYVANRLNEKLAAETPEGQDYTPWTKDSITITMVLDLVQTEYAAFLRGEIEEAADWMYVRRYCVYAERARNEGYDEQYAGLGTYLNYHAEVYAYYYDLIQEEHLLVLEEMLLKYNEAKTYVDKLGVCTYIENYIVKNSVNMERENDKVTTIATRLAEIKAELTPGEGEEQSEAEKHYLETLKANTILFIEAVDSMLAAQNQSYQALYDASQIALQYYYFMEINSDEVKAAIAEYAKYERKLIDWQINSDLFIETVSALNTEEASTRAGMYKILAKACALKPLANDTYEGMSEALSLYNAKYSEYMSVASVINAEVEQTVTVALAEREIFDVLGVISKFFAKVFG